MLGGSLGACLPGRVGARVWADWPPGAVAWRSQVTPRERRGIEMQSGNFHSSASPVLLIEDPEWSGQDLREVLTQAGRVFQLEDSQDCSVAVMALATESGLETLLARLRERPDGHTIVCCASRFLESRVREWASPVLSILGPGQEGALSAVLPLAGRLQSMSLLHRQLRPSLNGLLGFARLVLNTQMSSTQREYLEGILASGESLLGCLSQLCEPVTLAAPDRWSLSQRPGLPGPSLRILVADDNPVSRAMAVLVLEEQGHELALAEDGEQVLDLLKEQTFDLILMDVQMPRLDGYLTTRAIREQEKGSGRRLPILAVTAYGRDGDAEVCLATGMDGFVTKPIQEEELFEAMHQVLGWSDEQSAGSAEGILDREGLQRRLGGREGQLQRVIRQFLEMLPAQLEEVYQSFSRGDQKALSLALHRLKCSAVAFEAPRILEPIDQLVLATHRPVGLSETGAMLARLRRELEMLSSELRDLELTLTQPEELHRLVALPGNWPGLDRPLRVLVAEDNPINQTLLLTLLEEQSCEITVVENGQAAVDACVRSSFDVVLMDIQMPIMDGLEATSLLRQRGLDLPVVVMTASASAADYRSAGASHYLAKPVQEEALLEILEQLASLRSSHPAHSPAPDDDVIDAAALGERLHYKLERLARLSQVFHQVAPEHLAGLRRAVESRRPRELESCAQRFKTTLRTMEARHTLALAQQLELMGREGCLEGALEMVDQAAEHCDQIGQRLRQMLAEATILAQL